MCKIGEINGNPVIMDDKLCDMGISEMLSHKDIVMRIKNSATYSDVEAGHSTYGKVGILTWHERSEYKGVEYVIVLARLFEIKLENMWDYKLKIRVNKSIVIEEDPLLTAFSLTFSGKYIGIPTLYNDHLSKYMMRQLPTRDVNKDKLVEKLHTFIDKLINDAIPIYTTSLDDKISEINTQIDGLRTEITRLQDSKSGLLELFSINN
jgi:hypothetical protein